MTRRPVCLVCLFLMLCMCLADLAGVPLIRGTPLPETVQTYIKKASGLCDLRGGTEMPGNGIFLFCLSETSRSDLSVRKNSH